MSSPIPTIAILCESAALTSILGATLRQNKSWRVREFRDARALGSYMRIAPVAMLVCDYALGEQTAPDIILPLREDLLVISRHVQIIAMTRTIDIAMRGDCVRAGIDEVIVKPMSPLYLEERIRTRLSEGPRGYIAIDDGYVGPERRGRGVIADTRDIPLERRGENIVSFVAHKALRSKADEHLEPN
ncbi:response regulator [Pelagibacterium lentulum]|uniref:response regulator n=1 Tax=Pelagibacterium lentulum TaxID=2029865 RepID=UPI000F8C54D3|nr:response regulator [Pelagibacterium lentulum]